jgi:hypothetical protein
LVNPNIAIVLKDHGKESLLEEVLKDETPIFLAKLLNTSNQVLMLG